MSNLNNRRNQINNRRSSMLNVQVEVWKNDRDFAKNELGQFPIVQKLIKKVYACVIPQTGSALKRTAETVLTKTTHKIVTNYHADITSDCWIVYKNQRYNIIYISDPYNDNRQLEIFCEVFLQ